MTFMIHGPCGVQNRKSPCMQSERCTKFYPKKFWKILLLMRMAIQYIEGEIMEGLPEKGKKNINNRFVVSYNRYLLLRYNAHINVKWCNQSRSIKYLFKYVNISHNQITTNFYHGAVDSNDLECVDKIKLYYNCRYLSSCKACWRIFAFDINYLPNEQQVVFKDTNFIDHIVNKPFIKTSKFIA